MADKSQKTIDKVIDKCREGCTCSIKLYIPQSENPKSYQ